MQEKYLLIGVLGAIGILVLYGVKKGNYMKDSPQQKFINKSDLGNEPTMEPGMNYQDDLKTYTQPPQGNKDFVQSGFLKKEGGTALGIVAGTGAFILSKRYIKRNTGFSNNPLYDMDVNNPPYMTY